MPRRELKMKSESWEMKLSDVEIDRFELILLDTDGGSRFSLICPFGDDNKHCSKCIQLFSDIKNIDLLLKFSCPCAVFSPEIITERIEKLLQYNELMRKQKHGKT
jgi:hypothetical protein